MPLDTASDRAWAQYETNLAFAESHRAMPAARRDRPRVLVAGFGRFGEHRDNVSGRMVARLVPGMDEPAPGMEVVPGTDMPGSDEPGSVGRATVPTLAVGEGVCAIDGVGTVAIRGLVLPVVWDVAAVIVLREAEAFDPDLVIMNGIARPRQHLWLELGAINAKRRLPDVTGIVPVAQAPVVRNAPSALPNHASWRALARGAEGAIAREIAEAPGLEAVLSGVSLAGFPRASNGYLCNATTYAVAHCLSRPGQPFDLMEASHPRGAHGVRIAVERDLSAVPRLFVHWPSDLGVEAGARVLQALIAAQLSASEPPVSGREAQADLPADAEGGATF